MNPLVYIIILNWNGRDLTLDCLESFTKVKYDNYKILVVDNGSNDDSVDVIQKKYPTIELLQLENNIGYAGGNNAGFESLTDKKPEYIIFLNNDTLVDQYFIEPLIKPLLEKPNIGQTVPKIFYSDDQKMIWYAGSKVNLWSGQIYHRGIRKIDSDRFSTAQVTDYATGCCFAMRYDDFTELGGFDTSFPMYAEDVDLSLRIAVAGKKIKYIPESVIWHKVSASIGGEISLLKLKRKTFGLIKLFSNHANILQKLTIIIFWIISIPYLLLKFLYLSYKK